MNYSNGNGNGFPLNPIGFGRDFGALFDKTDLSISMQWQAYSENNFQNPFARANDALFEERGARFKLGGFWGAVARDRILSHGLDEEGRLKIDYVSNADTDLEQVYRNIRAPKSGWVIPNADCPIKDGKWEPFYPGTGVPFETIHFEFSLGLRLFELRKTAHDKFSGTGYPVKNIPYWVRPDKYRDVKGGPIVGRLYSPSPDLFSRFVVWADSDRSSRGEKMVGTFSH